MSAEATLWIQFATENLQVAKLCLDSELFNPCVQNAQQAVEKSLKAVCLNRGLALRRIHSIGALRNDLRAVGIGVELSDDECDLFDSVYLPSKYPLASVVPHYAADEHLAARCVEIAQRVLAGAARMMQK